MYHVDKYRMMAKREADARGLLLDKKAKKGKTQIEVKEEEKVFDTYIFWDHKVTSEDYNVNTRRKSRHSWWLQETSVDGLVYGSNIYLAISNLPMVCISYKMVREIYIEE